MIILYYHIIIASALMSLTLGLYALFVRKHSYLNRSFFRLSIVLFTISSAILFAVTADSTEEAGTILTRLSIAWFLFPVLFFRFITALTGYRSRTINNLLRLLYIIPIVLYTLTITTRELFSSFEKTNSGLVVYHDFKSPIFFVTLAYYVILISVSICLLFIWKKNNRGTIREKQASIITYSTLIVSVLLLIYRRISGLYLNVIPPPFFPVLLTFWLTAVAIAIFRYHMMTDFPRIVQDRILSHISDMVILLDVDENITFLNRQTEFISGYKADELMHKKISLILKHRISREVEYEENVIITKNGQEIPVKISKFFYTGSGGLRLGSIITASDLRLMKALQEEIYRKEKVMMKLKESESKFFKVFNSSPAGLVIFDTETGTVTEMNNKAVQIIGYTKEEFKDISFLFKNILVNNPENRTLVHILTENPKIANRNVIVKTKWGRRRTLFVSFESIRISGKPYLLLAGSDISEIVKMKEQLQKTHKMESIGMLAGGIAHDFNNMLTIINGNISLALSENNDSEIQEYLEESLEAGENAAKLTGQLLAFSRGKTAVNKTIDIHEVIRDSVKIALSGKKTTLSLYLDAEESIVYADRNQMQQVFINLIINAIQAMNNEGEVTVSTVNDMNKELIIISVTDFGKGIDEKDIEKIFDPFYSTKNSGTGLGLSIVYSIITKHSGTIEVSSQRDDGTTFMITLPLKRKR